MQTALRKLAEGSLKIVARGLRGCGQQVCQLAQFAFIGNQRVRRTVALALFGEIGGELGEKGVHGILATG